MKKVIGGKVYDTETARAVAETRHGEGPRDYHYFRETLYRKRTGEYFLAGVGGPLTKYSTPTGQNRWDGGEKIIPLAYDEAAAWAEAEMDADAYVAEFGAVGEDEEAETVRVNLSMPADAAERIRRAAAAAGMSVSAWVVARCLGE